MKKKNLINNQNGAIILLTFSVLIIVIGCLDLLLTDNYASFFSSDTNIDTSFWSQLTQSIQPFTNLLTYQSPLLGSLGILGLVLQLIVNLGFYIGFIELLWF